MAKIVERVGGRRVRVHEIPGDEWTLGALATADAPFSDPSLRGCTLRFVRWVSGWRVEDVGGEARSITIDGEEATGSDALPERAVVRVGSTELDFDGTEQERSWDVDETAAEQRASDGVAGDRVERSVEGPPSVFRAPPPRAVPSRVASLAPSSRPTPAKDPFGSDTARTSDEAAGAGAKIGRRIMGLAFWVLLIFGFQFGRRFLDGEFGSAEEWFSGPDRHEEVELTPLEVDLRELESDLETLESFPQTLRQDWMKLQGRVEDVSRRHRLDPSAIERLEGVLERINRRLMGDDTR